MPLGKKLLHALEGRTDLPLAFAAGLPRIEVEGLDTVRIEQHRGLAAYGPELVVVRCTGADLEIRGSRLTLEAMTVREMKLRGRILGLELRY
jgi:sporulation protein YqfC